jgi:hypothetical protein
MSGRKIVVDGANAAYAEKTDDGKPKVSNLVVLDRKLRDKGYDPVTIVDASLIYEVDDPEQLEGLLDQQKLRQAPADTDADYFVLRTAANQDAQIVSNDQYEAYQDEFDIEERRIPFMIVNGDVELYRPKLK